MLFLGKHNHYSRDDKTTSSLSILESIVPINMVVPNHTSANMLTVEILLIEEKWHNPEQFQFIRQSSLQWVITAISYHPKTLQLPLQTTQLKTKKYRYKYWLFEENLQYRSTQNKYVQGIRCSCILHSQLIKSCSEYIQSRHVFNIWEV